MSPARRDSPGNPFDELAPSYDAWFESERGRAIVRAELACLRPLLGPGRWLEVGVGTGRVARALGIAEGVEPSEAMARFARGRGIRVLPGRAEALPLPAASLDGLLLMVSLCFVQDPARALAEAARVLRPGGRLLVGLLPADGPWGRRYAEEGRRGHPSYRAARFLTAVQLDDLAARAGLRRVDARSCLFWGPDEPPRPETPRPGVQPGAGFLALAYERRA